MEIFKIVKDNKKSLREKSVPLQLPLDQKIIELGNNMMEYLIASQDEEFLKNHKSVRSGVGLAAPQVGHNIQLIAIYFKEDEKEYKYLLANPKIISESVKLCCLEGGEGCLSVDKVHEGFIYRPYKIKVKAFSLLDNEEVILELKGYPSIVVQHEIDHLKGVLFYDHIDKKNPFREVPNSIKI